MNEYILLKAYIFVFGAIIGSFLNVVIYRLPLKEDIVFKPSSCPKCKKNLRWYMNAPLLGFIALRGRCYYCKEIINPRYFIVELVTAAFAVYLVPEELSANLMLLALVRFSIFCILWCHFWIDIDHHILPNTLNLYLLGVVTPITLFYGNFIEGLMGALTGVLLPGSVAYIFYKLKKVEGLGMGDIKLYGVLGIMLGPVGVSLNIFFSCFLGVIIFVFLQAVKKVDRNTPIAFGPFIIVVAIVQLYFPEFFSQLSGLIL